MLISFLLQGCESTQASLKEQAEAAQVRKIDAAKLQELYRIRDAEIRAWDVLRPMMLEAGTYQLSESFGDIGAVFTAEHYYPERLRGTARQYSIGPYVSISQVFPGTVAEAAGLMEGDRILEVNGDKTPRWSLAARYASSRIKRDLVPGRVNRLKIQRSGQIFEVEVIPEKAAYYTVVVSPDAQSDVRADGEVIWLSLNGVKNLSDPTEFAYTCAYALAQNVMRHPEKRRKNLWIGQTADVAALTAGIPTIWIFGNATGNNKRRALQIEADLIALYLLASQGADLNKYSAFWQRQMPRSRRTGKMDARDLRRLEVQQQIIASIERKRDAGLFIFPEEYLSGDASEVALNRFGRVAP
ncbi:M48 family metallopeptidase [Pelagicoccus albus]|uniref:PDZ domain-containing protein n=1 Tax=Pelagicoccus albus TaxID=415222 RepID=A0A7X1B9C5_9BACT|nr:M48 family metallopeptidase [Pelagicoccus albus]MBC2607749.1 PDZ domain-containing protein [Pelagicoccus albus]